MKHRGFEAFIVCNNHVVNEYGFTPVSNDTLEIACWIPATPGEKFTVVWRDLGTGNKTAGYIYLDGVVVPGRFLDGRGETYRTGVRSGKGSERPFVFSMTTRDDEEQKTKDDLRNVGTIRLRIKRCESDTPGRPANPVGPYPERLVGKRRAGETCIGFGKSKPYYMQAQYTWKVVGPGGSRKAPTVVSFAFKYRPMDWLIDHGIVKISVIHPMPGAPVAPGGSDDEDEYDLEPQNIKPADVQVIQLHRAPPLPDPRVQSNSRIQSIPMVQSSSRVPSDPGMQPNPRMQPQSQVQSSSRVPSNPRVQFYPTTVAAPTPQAEAAGTTSSGFYAWNHEMASNAAGAAAPGGYLGAATPESHPGAPTPGSYPGTPNPQ
ncbi:hypothetical protein GGF50DRAFT_44883 [Schizophyllum commune]